MKDISKIRFSVEIEVEYPKSQCFEDTERKTYLEGWCITDDGSLDYGKEYKPCNENKLYFNKTSLAQIKKMLDIIKKNEGYVGSNCGGHIHIDVSKLKSKDIIKIINKFLKNQNKIIKKFKVHKIRLEEYCDKLPEHCSDESDKKYMRNITNQKFYALEKSMFNTLEFRLFNGTLNYEKIVKRIKWCLNFVANI